MPMAPNNDRHPRDERNCVHPGMNAVSQWRMRDLIGLPPEQIFINAVLHGGHDFAISRRG